MTKFGTLKPNGKVVNAMSIDLNKVKSPDPLAYAFGLFQGKLIGSRLGKTKGLAPEYIRGFKDGTKLKAKVKAINRRLRK